MSTQGSRPKVPADEWAREYYAGRASKRISDAEVKRLMRMAAGTSTKSREGLPENVPVPFHNGTELDDVAFMAACQKAASKGYGMAALLALRWWMIAHPEEALPRWIQTITTNAIKGWLDHTWETLEEAFQAKRPRAKSASVQFRRLHGGQILIDIHKARAAGVATDRDLFDSVGEHYGCSGSVIERIWLE